MPKASLEEKIYLAGIVDADGSIAPNYMQGGTPTIRVSISNQHPAPLDLAKSLYGGCIQISGQTCTQWMSNRNEEVVSILTDIEPYLRIKRKQAHLALCFYSLDVGKGGRGTPEQQVNRETRSTIAEMISVLNHTKTPYIASRIEQFKNSNLPEAPSA